MTKNLSAYPLYSVLKAIVKNTSGILEPYVDIPSIKRRLIWEWQIGKIGRSEGRFDQLVAGVLEGSTTLTQQFESLRLANAAIDPNAGTTPEFNKTTWTQAKDFEGILPLELVRPGASWKDLTRPLRSRKAQFFFDLILGPFWVTLVLLVVLGGGALVNGTSDKINLTLLFFCAGVGMFLGVLYAIGNWFSRPGEVKRRKELAGSVAKILTEIQEAIMSARAA